ncbi:hypothetical protein [Polymorphospora rubra]|uniref:Uncharacterized protein n=1 Tax=Polymorphospora rubra TaxID=338584 RepID=A0A810MYP3_9ACTN|nr:hypothetical protein [Polymorphospora rubra]BCJ65710.1 hypothetical protein Prubr_27310 [Polymorphospora rubra]
MAITIDALTKGLVDRFMSALAAGWKMSDGYDIYLPSAREVRGFLNGVAPSAPGVALAGGLGCNQEPSLPMSSALGTFPPHGRPAPSADASTTQR